MKYVFFIYAYIVTFVLSSLTQLLNENKALCNFPQQKLFRNKCGKKQVSTARSTMVESYRRESINISKLICDTHVVMSIA